jgi:hypothetical protein
MVFIKRRPKYECFFWDGPLDIEELGNSSGNGGCQTEGTDFELLNFPAIQSTIVFAVFSLVIVACCASPIVGFGVGT